MKQKGFTLIETVLYIAIVVILLGGLTTFLINTARIQSGLSPALRIKETASNTMLLMSSNITGADSINVTGSTLGVNPSTLLLTDGAGRSVQIDVIKDVVDFGGTSTFVDRLRLTKGGEPAVWLTDSNLDVTLWKVEEVSDSGGLLQGLKIEYTIETIDASVSGRKFSGRTTFPLTPNTVEL
ncbi:type II secretion system protein [Candidatus Uhrbacteria bacterium]|nr:type II secretion system protein [Candidatus Uhrbacteria bacterium]